MSFEGHPTVSEEERWTDVEHALKQAERGELLDEHEMDERVNRLLHILDVSKNG